MPLRHHTTMSFHLPIRPRRFAILLALVFSTACDQRWPEHTADVPVERFGSEHEAWRTLREARAVDPPGGPVLWIGLWELPMGATSFGSDPSLPITLPDKDAPALAGTLYRSDDAVYVVPSSNSPLSLHEGDLVTQRTRLRHNREPTPTRLSLGSLGLRVHSEPGTSRLWLRAWDEDHPARSTFRLPDYYPLDPSWNVPARFDAFREPRPIRIPDVTGGTIELLSLGEVVFRKDEPGVPARGDGPPDGYVDAGDDLGLDSRRRDLPGGPVPQGREAGQRCLDDDRLQSGLQRAVCLHSLVRLRGTARREPPSDPDRGRGEASCQGGGKTCGPGRAVVARSPGSVPRRGRVEKTSSLFPVSDAAQF